MFKKFILVCGGFLLVVVVGWSIRYTANSERFLSESDRIERLTASENQIEALSGSMDQLANFFREPGSDAGSVFHPQITYRGPVGFKIQFDGAKTADPLTQRLHLGISETESQVSPSKIWLSVRNDCSFEDCQLGILAGKFLDDNSFEMETKFEGRFRNQLKQMIGLQGLQTIQWTRDSSDQWRVSKWIQSKLDVSLSEAPLFQDVTTLAIPDPATLEKLQSSSHQQLLIKNANTPSRELKHVSNEFMHTDDWESAYQYPSVSVIDLDRDGFDDLFVTDRWQSAQLLHNNGDGTFKDVTEASGLKVEELACCALFADFDNDGDSDVFVGRTLRPSLFFENVNGVFRLDDSQSAEFKYLKFVVSGSVVDINRDGLLDLYLNTYGFPTDDSVWATDTFREQDRFEMKDRVQLSHWFLDRGGSPNILLLNDHGTLKRVEVDDTLAQWRNSYQTVWSDYDHDGDPDLYICNDFSPDYFLRNDTKRGSMRPEFVDVSEEMVAGGTMGFGMGACWGDYNNDGELDLYVSNMYSKAGNRIVSQLEGVNERIQVSARGNFLYEKQGEQFRQVAGLDPNDQQISDVGWSFGGQFADFDNDSNLDLYVPSGFYTPPKQIQMPGDL